MAAKKHQISPEYWYHRIWLPLCSFTYIAICIFDFIVMPVATSIHNGIIENRIVSEIRNNPTNQQSFVDAYEKSSVSTKQWTPITLQGGGLFHLSFGALLAAGATTRGLAKKAEVEGFYQTQSGAPLEPESGTKPPKV